MNIFVLDDDPVLAARYQCDKHVVKMVLETGQILSTVLRERGWDKPTLYRSTHKHHPCTLWAGKSKDNYEWLFKHFSALAQEYKHRYGRDHKTWEKLKFTTSVGVMKLPAGVRTPFALAMPEKFKLLDDAVESYRAYYKYEKAQKFELRYTNRERPEWLGDENEFSR